MSYTRCRRNLAAAAAAGANSRVTEHRYDVRKLAISGIDTLSLDTTIKLILMRSYKSYLYVDTFVTVAFYCIYMCMNFVHSCV